MQTPVVATLLSIIAKSNRAFPMLVLDKLSEHLMSALQTGDVVVARNHLRAYACLASAECVSLDGHGGVGLLHVLAALCDVAESQTSEATVMSVPAEAAVYLLASCVPYLCTALQHSSSYTEITSRILTQCRRVIAPDEHGQSRCSVFDTKGPQPVFIAAIDGTAALQCARDASSEHSSIATSPPGAVCWDNLWEVTFVHVDVKLLLWCLEHCRYALYCNHCLPPLTLRPSFLE